MIPYQYHSGIVLGVIAVLITSLYAGKIRPALTFFLSSCFLVFIGVLPVDAFLDGFSNKSVLTILLLITITSAIRKNVDIESYFDAYFKGNGERPGTFVFKMTSMVAVFSSIFNNTPIVALLAPYVHNWGQKHGVPPSKLLIPLSYATIVGGMITVIGTSTNLVLISFMEQSGVPPLGFDDFLYLGIMVTILGVVFLSTIGWRMLPERKDAMEQFKTQSRDYLVETRVEAGSPIIGKSISDAGLRNLKDVFVASIQRNQRNITPVSPHEVIEEGDFVIFTGKTERIFDLVNSDMGLVLPKEGKNYIQQGTGDLYEAIIPANSSLAGKKIKNSNFRQLFDSAIVAIHRNGERVNDKIGNIHLMVGDLLLLMGGKSFATRIENSNDLYVISKKKGQQRKKKQGKPIFIALIVMAVFMLGILDVFPLFNCLLFILAGLILINYLSVNDIKRELDFNLFIILVSSLAIGDALIHTGGAEQIAQLFMSVVGGLGNEGILIALFLLTVTLTSFVTNVAAVSIAFPIASAMNADLGIDSNALYVAVAFGASSSFLTPIGYQTNLIVYGPGGYEFKDFFKIGIPLTFLYTALCVTFIILNYPM